MPIEIRKLGPSDAGAYWELRLEAVEQEPLSFGQSPEEHCLISIEETMAFIETPVAFVMGGFDGSSLVAFARFEREKAKKERHKGHVYRVYVTASYRGRGLAGTIIRALIDTVRKDPTVEQLLLSVGTFNLAARSVYASLGFETYGVEPRALKEGGRYVDEEHMILLL